MYVVKHLVLSNHPCLDVGQYRGCQLDYAKTTKQIQSTIPNINDQVAAALVEI